MSDRKNKPAEGEKGTAQAHRPVPEWLAVKLDFPPDVLSGGMRIELRGRHSMLVHGCRRILHYTSEEMRLALQNCVLCITGQRLVCHSFLAGAVGVDGLIQGICFLDEDAESARP
ncbi:MAG: hypothetical protein E7661_08435 [Ruminococcaceae bacterium]|nr:hypothetical protein [Oscillospiraceae bacterium]